MEQIAENTADSLTESVKEVNQFTQYFQGKMPGLMDLGIKLVIVLIAFFVCRKIIQLILWQSWPLFSECPERRLLH